MYHIEKSELAELYNRSPLPLYLQVAKILRRRITTGQWLPHERIPSLDALAKELGVARLTVRQGIEQLENEGLIWKKQGKGTFVADGLVEKNWFTLQTKWSELVKMVKGTSLKLLYEKENVKLPGLGPIKGNPSSEYHFMRRLHVKGDEPYCLAEVYLVEEIFKKAPDLFKRQNLVYVLDNLEEINIATARQVLTVGTADIYIANYLNLAVDSPVINLRRTVIDSDGVIIYVGDLVYCGDHIKLDIHLEMS